ncbi:MAG: cation-translocating P-type ATPase [Candidatus Shapirobacteria bacterium]|jgi:Cd2+/Zn2+-exporting ATPase
MLQNKKLRSLLIALLIVLPFEILSILSIHLPSWIEYPLFLTIAIIFGKNVLINGIKSLFHLRFSDINLLMSIAILGATYLGELEEAVIIIVLFALGEALEDFGIERSQDALKKLVEDVPKTAQIKGKELRTSVEKVLVGDIIVIKPGDKIPLDGEIVEGSSLVDEASITGEPLPKNKYLGDMVYAGTASGNGYLEVKITKLSKDSTLAKIIDLTYSAAEKKSSSQRFIEKFAGYYTPTILFIAMLTVLIPVAILGKPFNPWFIQALTLLIISCPCALVISTPITIFSAIGNATKRGILIKGGKFIEELGKIKAVAFDKTRTLTKGEPIVSDVVPFNGFTKEKVLACASGIESFSEHPLAKSIIEEAKKYNLSPHKFTNFSAVAGKGLTGDCLVCTDKHHCMGNLRFITEEHNVSKEVLKLVDKFESQGKTTIIMSDNQEVTGVIAITDEIREESQAVVDSLINLNIKSTILTGDNESSANFVATQVGIKDIKANLLPEQKVTELNKLINKYSHVAMVGDGVNDAPSLVTASVGIAMGAVGSDVAIENADVALMNNNLALIPFLVELGRKSLQTIRINTATAVGVKLLFLTLALVGKSSLALAIFADVGVTILVVLNGLQLFGYQGKISYEKID